MEIIGKAFWKQKSATVWPRFRDWEEKLPRVSAPRPGAPRGLNST